MLDHDSTDETVAPTLGALQGDKAPVVLPSNLPASNVTAFDAYLASTSGKGAQILKFKKGRWTAGTAQTLIPLDTEMAVDVSSIRDGHVKWIDKRPVNSAMTRIVAGPFTPREELDDLDESMWPVDPVSGKPRDSWARTKSVLLKDTDTWEEFTLSTSSVGGLNCIGNLVQKIRAGIAKGLTGIPIVKLESDSYMHELYDEVFTPQLPIVAWKSEAELMGGEPDPEPGLDDEIPF